MRGHHPPLITMQPSRSRSPSRTRSEAAAAAAATTAALGTAVKDVEASCATSHPLNHTCLMSHHIPLPLANPAYHIPLVVQRCGERPSASRTRRRPRRPPRHRPTPRALSRKRSGRPSMMVYPEKALTSWSAGGRSTSDPMDVPSECPPGLRSRRECRPLPTALPQHQPQTNASWPVIELWHSFADHYVERYPREKYRTSGCE